MSKINWKKFLSGGLCATFGAVMIAGSGVEAMKVEEQPILGNLDFTEYQEAMKDLEKLESNPEYQDAMKDLEKLESNLKQEQKGKNQSSKRKIIIIVGIAVAVILVAAPITLLLVLRKGDTKPDPEKKEPGEKDPEKKDPEKPQTDNSILKKAAIGAGTAVTGGTLVGGVAKGIDVLQNKDKNKKDSKEEAKDTSESYMYIDGEKPVAEDGSEGEVLPEQDQENVEGDVVENEETEAETTDADSTDDTNTDENQEETVGNNEGESENATESTEGERSTAE